MEAIRLMSRVCLCVGMSEKSITSSTPNIAALLPTMPILKVFSLKWGISVTMEAGIAIESCCLNTNFFALSGSGARIV